MLTEEAACDESPAQPFQRLQERRVSGKRAAPLSGTQQVAGDGAPGESSEFELQLRSTLA